MLKNSRGHNKENNVNNNNCEYEYINLSQKTKLLIKKELKKKDNVIFFFFFFLKIYH